MIEGKIQTTLGHTYRFEETGEVHQLMGEGKLPEGNVADPGSTRRARA